MNDGDYSDPRQYFRLLQESGSKLPMPSAFISIEEADSRGKKFLAEIWKHYDELQDILLRYELQIRKRWESMTFSKRQALLKSIWPTITQHHNMAIHLFYKAGISKNSTSRDNFLLPYMNIEDVCRDASHLLGLLHYRGRFSPDQFALFDYDQLHCGIIFEAIDRVFVNECCMQIYGDRESYGKMLLWDDEDDSGYDAWSKQNSFDALQPFDALVVFEAQSKLLIFLCKVAKGILSPQTVNLKDPREAENVSSPPIGLSSQKNASSKKWTSISETHWLQPFLGPPEFSLEKIRRIAVAHRDEMQDHWWLLQSDPTYFYQQLKVYDDHRAERTPGDKCHPELETPIYYDRVVGALVTEAANGIAVWSVIEKEVTRLEQIRLENVSKIGVGLPLPESYNIALEELALLVTRCLDSRLFMFRHLLMGSPGFRNHFHHLPPTPGSTKITAVLKKGSPDSLFRSDRLLWILLALLDKDHGHAFGVGHLLDEFDRILQEDPQKHLPRLSGFLLNIISDICAYNEIMTILKNHRPRSEIVKEDPPSRWKILEFIRGNGKWEEYKLGKHATPFSIFSIPGGPKDQEWENKAVKALEALKSFWKVVEEKQRQIGGEENLFSMFQQLLKVHQSPPEPEKPKAYSNAPKHSVQFAESEFIEEVKWNDSFKPAKDEIPIPVETPDPVEVFAPATTKVKTRGQPNQIPDQQVEENTAAEAIPKITVPRYIFRVLTKLFSTPKDEQSGASSILWKDLVEAMITLGFTAEKKRGSVWMFYKEGASINVHEPHPEKVFPLSDARFLGRRLRRRYGWNFDTFALSEK